MVLSADVTTHLPDEPLDFYRSQASFNCKEMLKIMEPPSLTNLKIKVWSYLAAHPEYSMSSKIIASSEEKERTAKLLFRFLTSGFFDEVSKMKFRKRTRYLMTVNEALEMLNPQISIKLAVGISLSSNIVHSLGSEKHLGFFNDLWKGKILSCLAITELAHGSDTKRLKTTATYDPSRNEFILNSPGIESAKCWVGNLGRQCTHGLVFAQLIVGDTCHGLHVFIVPIRNPITLIPYPNITVGDIGEKAGLHGIDNGFIMFHDYRIPQDNLLDKIGGINEHGEYETSFPDPQKLLGAALESLSAGRVGIIQESSNTLIKAIVIAIRYAVQRQQFCDNDGKELSLIEYQTHQWRLFPYVAAAYVFKSFVHQFSEDFINFLSASRAGELDMERGSALVKGVHSLVCCTKALISWTTQTGIQECREACGGHGYHKAAALGDLRSNHDPRVTFEGDNTVLLQQTSNWLLRLYKDSNADFSVYPASEISFIKRKDSVLKKRFPTDSLQLITDEFIMETYQWLICWLCSSTHKRIKELKAAKLDKFSIKNQTQVFQARTLSLVFAEYMVLSYFLKICKTNSAELRPVLQNLFQLYGTWSLHKHIPVFYHGGFCNNPQLVELLSNSIVELCTTLKPEVVALCDTLAPPDFVLNSVLGCSNGKNVKTGLPKERIKGIGFDATCSLVVVGKDDLSISVSPEGEKEQNIILWMDHRAKEEADFINSLGHKLLKNVGGKISLEMEIPKLLWLKKHLYNECWAQAGKFFDLPDFLTWRATGVDTRSLCSLVCKWMYEVIPEGQKRWNPEFFKQIGLEDLLLDNAEKIGSEVREPGQAVGQGLTAVVAASLDLEIGTAVGVSLIDAHAGGLGMIGSRSSSVPYSISSRIGLICGTSTCHMAVSEQPVFVPGVWGPYWSAMVPGLWLNEAGQSATGSLIDHIISTHPARSAIHLPPGKHIVDHLNCVLLKMAERTKTPIDLLTKDLHIWPDFHGNRSPIADPTLRGMVCGLGLQFDEEQLALLYLATIQALSYGTKNIMEVLSKEGYSNFSAILICGGLSKNKLFVKTQASVCGIPVLVPHEAESVLLGAAMLGATASGMYPSVISATKHMSSEASVVLPDLQIKRYHELKYKIFLKMLADQLHYRNLMAEIQSSF